MIKVEEKKEPRVCQGDILKDIEFIEYAVEKDGKIEISKILFPLVIVLSQDCDLQQDFNNRQDKTSLNQDKYLISVIVAPIYNLEHVYRGEHLSELGLSMSPINHNTSKTENKFLRNNQNPRYHFLEFSKVPIVDSVIDFKHYFTVNIRYLDLLKQTSFVCKVSELYRESISQRFAYFLSRIGLPELK